jgi:hypothetical protein
VGVMAGPYRGGRTLSRTPRKEMASGPLTTSRASVVPRAIARLFRMRMRVIDAIGRATIRRSAAYNVVEMVREADKFVATASRRRKRRAPQCRVTSNGEQSPRESAEYGKRMHDRAPFASDLTLRVYHLATERPSHSKTFNVHCHSTNL